LPSFAEARQIILDAVPRLGPEVVPLLDAVGRVLAEDVVAPVDLPRWDNSAMDGFAIRSGDALLPGGLRVEGFLPAGAAPLPGLAPGTAVRILTGAPVPPGADAIVPLEEAEERDGAVRALRPVRPGAHVRRRGEDLRAGDTALTAGTILGPAEISALATCSRLSVPVVRRPRVAILSTGDELVEPGAPLPPGAIHDSNSWAVAAAVREIGAVPTVLGIARDDRAALGRLLAEGLGADALVTTAGVSMGDRDLVRLVLEELGVRSLFWKVDIKPGRPTAFALGGRTPVFSLPGNPVSTLLTFEQFVRPALLRMMGHARVLRPLVPAVLRDELPRRPGRVQFVRVRLERSGATLLARSAGNQDTGILKTMLDADGMAVIPAERGTVEAGGPIEVQLLRPGLELCAP
jgi:molybdopterin molybdotransferase